MIISIYAKSSITSSVKQFMKDAELELKSKGFEKINENTYVNSGSSASQFISSLKNIKSYSSSSIKFYYSNSHSSS